MKILNPIYQQKDVLIRLKKEFLYRKKVKYIVLDDFLESNFYAGVLQEIGNNKIHVTGDKDGRQVIHIRGKYLSQLYDFYTSSELKKMLSFFYDAPVYLELHTGGSNIIPEFLVPYIYKGGAFLRRNKPKSSLDWHTDGPTSKIAGSFLLYLNDTWDKKDAGELELGERGLNDIIRPYMDILPIGNRLVLLKCEENKSWHRVHPAIKDRIFLHDQVILSNL